jgi:hypothetical protein
MGEFTTALITGLMITLIAAVIIFFLILRHMRDQRKWERIAEDNYLLGKDEASDLLRQTCDKIAEDRQLLAGRSERAILTEILLTLDSQNRRMDRMDDKLKCISHYKTYLADVGSKTQTLSQSFAVLEKDLSLASASVEGLEQIIGNAALQLENLLTKLSGMDQLQQAVSNYASQLSRITLTLEYLQEQTAAIVSNMENVMETHDQSPAKRLKTVEMEITGLSLLVTSLHESLEEMTASAKELGDSSQLEALTSAVQQLRWDMAANATAKDS